MNQTGAETLWPFRLRDLADLAAQGPIWALMAFGAVVAVVLLLALRDVVLVLLVPRKQRPKLIRHTSKVIRVRLRFGSRRKHPRKRRCQ